MVLPDNVENSEVIGVFAATRVSVLEGNGLQHTEAWAAIRASEALLFPTDPQKPKEKLALSEIECYGMFSTPSAHPTKVLRTSRPEFRRQQQTYKSLLRQEWSLCCSVIRREHEAAIFCVSICELNGSVQLMCLPFLCRPQLY